MASLVLIRHAHVRAERGKPHHLWGLTEAGRAAAAALADDEAIRELTTFAASTEPKAIETAAAMANGRPTVEVEDLGELDRSVAGWIGSDEERIELIRAIFDNPTECVRGCESAAHAQDRFVRAVDGLLAQRPHGRLGVVSHGTVLALYMAHLRGLTTVDIQTWKAIKLPDVAVVDPLARTVIRDFGGLA